MPDAALPQCIAVAVTVVPSSFDVPGYDDVLSSLVRRQIRDKLDVVLPVLREMWIICAKRKYPLLPGFRQLEEDTGSQGFLTTLSADVLRTGIDDDHQTVSRLVCVLMDNDRQAALAIGETQIDRTELSPEVRTVWATALFAIDPNKHLQRWRTFASVPDTVLWQAIELIGGSEIGRLKGIGLTPVQRAEVVNLIGKRFAFTGASFQGVDQQSKSLGRISICSQTARLVGSR